MFYFDVRAYVRMLRLVGRESDRQRRRRLRLLLAAVPFVSAVHALCFALDRVLYPGLRTTAVRSPVFVVGHARSGTTLLHHLMTADAGRFSWFRTYEMAFPSLVQKKAIRAAARFDRRVLGSRIERRVRAWEDRRFEKIRRVHPTGLTEPEEDNFVLTFSCTGGFWPLLLPYVDQLGAYDVDAWPERKRRRILRFYAECVRRQLYLNGTHKLHLSKNPSFSGWVESLIETFPDARIVVAVRNPYETIPSLLKLMTGSWKARGWERHEMERSLRVLAGRSFHTYRHPFEVLARNPSTRHAVVDYRELIEQPKRTVERVYGELGFDVPERLAAALLAEQEQAREHRSRHRYSLEEFGLQPDAIRTELGELFERFGWDEVPVRTEEAR